MDEAQKQDYAPEIMRLYRQVDRFGTGTAPAKDSQVLDADAVTLALCPGKTV